MITKTPKPFFSIITVTLNNLDGLKRTHNSIKNQTLNDFEWIIIDGASTDGSAEYIKTTDANWISEPDNGIYDAMNKGIERANGEYLLFLNAGDELAAPETLAKIQNAATNTPAFIYGDALENDKYKPARKANITSGMFTHHQSMLYNRKALGNLRYDEQYKIAADYDFTARFLKENPNALYCPFPICNFEPGGLSQTNATLGRNEQYQIRKTLGLTNPLSNIIITGSQALLLTLRRTLPTLYWHLKSSGNSAPGNAQNHNQRARPETPA